MEENSNTDDSKVVYDSKIYSTYRQNSPAEIISKIMHHLKEKYKGPLDVAVDVGCGTGQSTLVIAPYFTNVYGIDSQTSQIQEAKRSRKVGNVEYRLGPSEILPFADGSVQLITASTSLHWFDLDRFFPEAKRILCDNGILAVYINFRLKPLLKSETGMEAVEKLYDEYFAKLLLFAKPKAQIALHDYKTINFPFKDVTREENIRCQGQGHLSDILGFAKTFAPFQCYQDHDPVQADYVFNIFKEGLEEVIAQDNAIPTGPLTLCRDYTLIICRK